MAEVKKDVVKKEEFAVVPISEGMMDAFKEELDGLGAISFDVVKIPSGGGLAFEIPGDDPDKPQTVNELIGVILYHHPVNALWEEKYEGGNEAPDCSSMDGKTGVDLNTGAARTCATCKYNQFGSADDGKGKACKNMHRVYLLQEGEQLPIMLSIPPTSLSALRDYLAKRVVLKGNRSFDVVTKVSLKKETSSGGIKYSRAAFAKVGDLSTEQKAAIVPSVETIKTIARRVEVSDEAYNPYTDGGTSFTEVDSF